MSSAYDLEMPDPPKPRPRYRVKKAWKSMFADWDDPFWYTVQYRLLFNIWIPLNGFGSSCEAVQDMSGRLKHRIPTTYIYPEPQ